MTQTAAQKTKNVRLGDIVIDPTYQVRMKVDSRKVADYANAMKNGDIFPPMIVEKKTGKLVCGFTRMEAYTRVFEPNGKVPGIAKMFKNDLERQFFAVDDNRRHGQPLDAWDKKNIACNLGLLGAPPEKISKVLGWSLKKVQGFMLTVVSPPGKVGKGEGSVESDKGKKEYLSGQENETGVVLSDDDKVKLAPHVIVEGQPRVLRAGLDHLSGKVISVQVYENMEHYSGWPDSHFISQILMRLNDGTFDLGNQKSVKSMQDLCKTFAGIIRKSKLRKAILA